MIRKRRCWYCGREGRFGWKSRISVVLSPECRNDKACFKRADAKRGVFR